MYFTYGAVKMHYETHGSGMPVVILHGRGADMRLMTACMEPLFTGERTTTYRRIYIDLPGMGQSSANLDFASADKILEVLLACIDSVVDGDFLLVGESYGGYLAQGILTRMPKRVKGLMLLCPVVVPEFKSRALPHTSVQFQDADYLANLNDEERQEFLRTFTLADSRTHRRYIKELKSGINIANIQFIRLLAQHYAFSFDALAKLNDLQFAHASLVVAGRQDHVVGYEDAWKLLPVLPRATFAVLDTAGHNAQIERADLFEALAKDWLERTERYND